MCLNSNANFFSLHQQTLFIWLLIVFFTLDHKFIKCKYGGPLQWSLEVVLGTTKWNVATTSLGIPPQTHVLKIKTNNILSF